MHMFVLNVFFASNILCENATITFLHTKSNGSMPQSIVLSHFGSENQHILCVAKPIFQALHVLMIPQ